MNRSNEERDGFLRKLDSVEYVVATFGRVMLGLVIMAVLAVVVVVVIRRPWGAGNQGEWFYFTIAVLLVLGWAGGQFIALGRRLRRRRSSANVEAPATFHMSNQGGVHKFEFRFGSSNIDPPPAPNDE